MAQHNLDPLVGLRGGRHYPMERSELTVHLGMADRGNVHPL
jgi:hypothetical protein